MVTRLPCTLALPGRVTIPDDVRVIVSGSLELGVGGAVRDQLLSLLMGLDEGSVPRLSGDHVEQTSSLHVEGALEVEAEAQLPWDLEVDGDVEVGKNAVVMGSLRCKGKVRLGRHASVHGELRASELHLAAGARVRGDVDAQTVSTE